MAKSRRLAAAAKPLTKVKLNKLRREHARWEKVVAQPLKEKVRQSEQLTDRDFAIRINTRAS